MESDLNALISTFDDSQLEILCVCALKIAKVRADKFTGHTLIEIGSNQGSFGDPTISQKEVVRLGKKSKRRVRSKLQ